jgi:signal peptidase II
VAYFGILIIVLGIDQLTKIAVTSSFSLYEKVVVIPGFFNLTYVTNRGAAFSFLAEVDSPWRHYFFITVSILALILLTVLWFRVRLHSPVQGWGLALIAGGAGGNLIDRVRFGAVIDFIDIYWRGYHWPAFNIADSAICIGVGLFIITSLMEKDKETNKQRR